jgi:HEPN domain-containing protein
MNRTDLQQLAELRIKEAQLLLGASSYPGAYYLAGYAVECALKACIAKQTREHDFPDKDFVNKSWTHKLDKLLNLAELEDPLNDARRTSNELDAYWAIVVNWQENKRYDLSITQQEARSLCDAIYDPANGVLQC